MLRKCISCPGTKTVQQVLISKFDEDTNVEITFSQRTSVDRSELISLNLLVTELIAPLITKLKALIPNSYIAKTQSQYLKRRKEELRDDTILILMDFSENFIFVVQDEAQGYHWTNSSCSLHPVVLYFKDTEGSLSSLSLCFLSDDMHHDVAFVYHVQKDIAAIIKLKFPSVTNVEYFTDGCAGQYKNCKSFLNLCKHKEDFGLHASWLFFATSHGKSPCDGIRGTIKRLTAKASL